MGAPQVILLCLWTASFMLHAAKHGEMKDNPRYHAGKDLIGTLLLAALLWWGGFWD